MSTQHPEELELAAWLDGISSAEKAREIERHLAECSECREMATEFRAGNLLQGGPDDSAAVETVLNTVLADTTTCLVLYIREGDVLLADTDWSTLPPINPAGFFEGVQQNANALSSLEMSLPSLPGTASIHVADRTACVLLLGHHDSIHSVWRLPVGGAQREEISPTLGVYALSDLKPGMRYEFSLEMADGSWQRLCCQVEGAAHQAAGREWVRALARALATGRIRAFDAMLGLSAPGDRAVAALGSMRAMLSGLFSQLWSRLSQQVSQRGVDTLNETGEVSGTESGIPFFPETPEYAITRARAWLLWKAGDHKGARELLGRACILAREAGVATVVLREMLSEQEMMGDSGAGGTTDAPFAVFDALWPAGIVPVS